MTKMTLAALALLLTFACADAGSLRGSLEDRMRALEDSMGQEIAALKQEVKHLKATQVLPAGALLTFVDGRTVCPEGTAEPNATKGMVLVGRPEGGATGATFNRPFDAGEVGRTPAHSHAASVKDLGHVHANGINDPGHYHDERGYPEGSGQPAIKFGETGNNEGNFDTASAFTGITISNAPAKSNIKVSIDADDAGEHYPLVYVLVCQKAL